MFSTNARRAALLLSLALCVFSQTPVITAEHNEPGAAHPAPLMAAGTTSDTSTIYDANESLWKRWSLQQGKLVLQTSVDGNVWSTPSGAVFDVAGAANWDAGSIASPTVVLNPSAADPARRFMLCYSGAATSDCATLPTTDIGLAYSADGRHFERLSADESPYHQPGLVIASAGSTYGEPRLTIADNHFELSYFRVRTANDGTVEQAGLGTASSDDGIKWAQHDDSAFQVQVVGKTTTTPKLVQRLRQLVDAYSECPM